MSSLTFTITCFSTSHSNDAPLAYSLMKHFIDNHIVVGLAGQEKVSSEFTYQVKLGHTAHFKIFYVSSLEDKNAMAKYSDLFLLFVNLENKDDSEKIVSIAEYLENLGLNDQNVFVIGYYKEKEKVCFGKKEIEMKIEQYSFENTYTEIEDGMLSKAIEGLFITIYEGKESTIKKYKYDGDKAKSRCIII